MDVDNDPIKNAKVTLISSSYPYRFEKTRETKMTSNDGKAKFESKKEWRIEALMLHGAEIFFWNWCVYKEGFETYRTAKGGDHEFVEEPIIILKQGKSQECPKRLL